MRYIVQATVTRKTEDGYTCSIQVPTFFLDSGVQGIVSEEHAERIAASVVNPTNDPAVEVHAALAAQCGCQFSCCAEVTS